MGFLILKYPVNTGGKLYSNTLNHIKKNACMVIVFLTVILQALPVAGKGKESIDIKVGFFAFEEYHDIDEDGKKSGYGYDILQHLAGYGGFRYEYIGYDKSWEDMLSMLENGEIDILTSAQKTQEREEIFDYSSSNIGVSSIILTVNPDNTTLEQLDFSNWNGIRVGMIKGSSRTMIFPFMQRKNNFTYKRYASIIRMIWSRASQR